MMHPLLSRNQLENGRPGTSSLPKRGNSSRAAFRRRRMRALASPRISPRAVAMSFWADRVMAPILVLAPAWPPRRAVNMPRHSAAAAGTGVPLAAAGPGRLVELGLVDLPYAVRATQESQRYRPADSQEVMRPNLRYAQRRARLAGVATPGAAKASCTKDPIAPAGVIGRDDA